MIPFRAVSCLLLAAGLLAGCANGGPGGIDRAAGERDARWEDRVYDMTSEDIDRRRSSITGY